MALNYSKLDKYLEPVMAAVRRAEDVLGPEDVLGAFRAPEVPPERLL